MRLVMVRHAVTAETGKRLSGRAPDIPLSAKGRQVAAELAETLAGLEPAAVLTSPIQRCRETAAILALPHGMRPRVRQGLVEVEYGAWTGRTLRSLYRLRAWRELMADPAGFRFPAGETLEEVRRRAVALVTTLGARHPDDTVLAVSHGDVIRSVAAHSLTGSVDLIHRLAVAPLGVSVFAVSPDHGLQLSVLNAPSL